jgi:hypothetical protein
MSTILQYVFSKKLNKVWSHFMHVLSEIATYTVLSENERRITWKYFHHVRWKIGSPFHCKNMAQIKSWRTCGLRVGNVYFTKGEISVWKERTVRSFWGNDPLFQNRTLWCAQYSFENLWESMGFLQECGVYVTQYSLQNE